MLNLNTFKNIYHMKYNYYNYYRYVLLPKIISNLIPFPQKAYSLLLE